MAKIRVYELAKELGKENKSLVEVILGLGIEIKNQMSTLTPDQVDRVRRSLDPNATTTGSSRRADTVIRRRGGGTRRREAEEAAAAAPPSTPTPTPTVRPAPPSGGPMVRPGGPITRPAPPSASMAAASPGVAGGGAGMGSVSSSAPQVRRVVDRPPPASVAERPSMPPPDRAPVSRPAASPSGDGGGQPQAEDGDASAAPVPSPAVGTRIQLPPNTRRLPGGMAQRIDERDRPQPVSSAPERQAPITRPGPRSAPGSAGEVSRNVGSAPATTSVAPPREGAAPVRAADDGGGGRRVVRNDQGVIVGAAPQRSEPRILGFIPLAQTRKRQQVIITDAAEEDKRGRASQRKVREERAQAQGRRRKMTRGVRGRGPSAPSKISTVEMSEEKKRIRVDEAIQVSDLAHQMGQKASIILRQLWAMGMRGITINNAIDVETAELVAAEFGYTVENVAFQEGELIDADEEVEGVMRAPVVTFMGHVDHGKTSLLDYIREARVAAGEAGGITQHIGAYRVETKRGPVVFLDTPGHEAFTAMRSRGAQVTDLVVLVVAADDGVMPTTIEAIKHANESDTPIVVAINKVDKPEANPGRVKQALMEYGIVGEEFGGDTAILEVSAKTGKGIDQLLENLALQAEILELRAPEDGRASGVVLEARIDKGRGTVATVLVQSGLLRKGDIVVANEFTGKARQLFDDRGLPLDEAGPSTPVEILGLSGVPQAGDSVHVVESDRDAKALVAHRREQRKRKESVRAGPSIQELLQRRKTPVLKVVLRADVQGSAQALKETLEELSTEKVKVEVIKAEVGQINETDVKYARDGAVIFGFNVKTAGKAAPTAEAEGVQIHTFEVIYDAVEKTKELMVALLEPEYREKEQGEAEVRALFPIPRLGVVAGCRVLKGLIQRSSHVRVVRGRDVVHTGTILSLKVFKDDVREVKDGHECGIVVDGFPSIQEGDIIQAFEVEAIPPSL
jgi:translation initiation factor IF-2